MYEAYKNHTSGYSPVYVKEDELPAGSELVNPLEDLHRIKFSREQLKKSGSVTVRFILFLK